MASCTDGLPIVLVRQRGEWKLKPAEKSRMEVMPPLSRFLHHTDITGFCPAEYRYYTHPVTANNKSLFLCAVTCRSYSGVTWEWPKTINQRPQVYFSKAYFFLRTADGELEGSFFAFEKGLSNMDVNKIFEAMEGIMELYVGCVHSGRDHALTEISLHALILNRQY